MDLDCLRKVELCTKILEVYGEDVDGMILPELVALEDAGDDLREGVIYDKEIEFLFEVSYVVVSQLGIVQCLTKTFEDGR